jgi:hypothetical protein
LKVKEILSILPRYSDNSGYDVKFVKVDPKHARFNWESMRFSDDLLESEIESIQAGRTRIGGHYDEDLHVYIY